MTTIPTQNTQSNNESLDKTPKVAQQVLEFWFNDDHSDYWFEQNDQFDAKIKEQFGEVWEAARAGECAEWRVTLEGALAEIIVLDQFSRNLNRNSPEAFMQDDMALVLAQEAVKREGYATLPREYRRFIIMPFMHSESRVIHEKGLPLFKKLGDENTLNYEVMHKDIIDRFGRYPHRNDVLDRDSTDEEIEFLKQPNSSF